MNEELIRRLREYVTHAALFIEERQAMLEAADALEAASLNERRPVLPFITPKIAQDFGGNIALLVPDSSLPSGYDWTQEAVDFACLITDAALSGEGVGG